jgi:hypothetical protein
MLSEFWIGGIAGALGGTAVALLAGRMWGARKRPTRGAVDICQHNKIAGWAVNKGKPSPVTLRLNSNEIAFVEPTVSRPDVAQLLGTDEICGYSYDFPRAIGASDFVEVEIGNTGTYIDPKPHRHRVASIVGDIDKKAPGLEIGALDKPFLVDRI